MQHSTRAAPRPSLVISCMEHIHS